LIEEINSLYSITFQCLGNHEFDLGVDPLVRFLDNVTFDVVSANTDVSDEPRLVGKFASSTIKTIGGERVGVIGYITPETKYISKPGKTILIFLRRCIIYN